MTADSDRQPPAGVPSDYETASGVLRSLDEAGVSEQFVPGRASGTLRCSACGSAPIAEQFEVLSERRLEGASDPDDMVLIVAARCPVCGARGAVVLGYGPQASPEDVDVVMALGRSHRRPCERENRFVSPESRRGSNRT
jgi:hypothetical protein